MNEFMNMLFQFEYMNINMYIILKDTYLKIYTNTSEIYTIILK